MSEQTVTDGQDPRVELVQAVYDRVNSYEESATTEKIAEQLDEATSKAGIELDADVRERVIRHIDSRGGREDVSTLF